MYWNKYKINLEKTNERRRKKWRKKKEEEEERKKNREKRPKKIIFLSADWIAAVDEVEYDTPV